MEKEILPVLNANKNNVCVCAFERVLPVVQLF